MKLSIVVPAYNAQAYLSDCVESILRQSYTDYELLLVDDGSTDCTGALCDEYAKKDSRIVAVHQENGGQSCARNTAIRIATGDYVGFLDADDYYSPDALTLISRCISENGYPDVFIGRFDSFSEKTSFAVKDAALQASRINGKKTDEVLEYLLSIPFMYTHCRYYVKRSLIQEKDLEFAPRLAHEDEAWTPILLTKAGSFCCAEKPFYIYRVHSNSFMTTRTVKKQIDKLEIAKRFSVMRRAFPQGSVSYRLYEDRTQKLALSAVSESYVFPMKEIRQLAKAGAALYSEDSGAFNQAENLKKLIKVFGCENAVLLWVTRVKLHHEISKQH